MKQISAVRSALERSNRVMLHNHLETRFSQAVLGGRGATAIDELVDALGSLVHPKVPGWIEVARDSP